MRGGFRFGRSQGMEGSTSNLREFAIDPANTNPIFTGDLVNIGPTGFIEEATGAAANDDFDITGIFWGCRYVAANGDYEFANQWDGGGGRSECFASVLFPSGATWLVPGAEGQVYTQADIGTRKGVIYNAGIPATGQSMVTLGAAGATVATGPLTVVKMVDIPENPKTSDQVWFEVTVNRQALTASGA